MTWTGCGEINTGSCLVLSTNKRIADLFDETAHLLEMEGENPFKIRSYTQGARVLEALDAPVEQVAAEGRLRELEGIGEALEKKILEYLAHGRIEFLEKLRVKYPEQVIELLRVQGLGPKRVIALYREHGIDSLERLRHACETGELAGIKGYGRALQDKVLESIEFLEERRGLYRLNTALESALELRDWLGGDGCAEMPEIAGDVRRHREVVRDVRIIASADAPRPLLERFMRAPGVAEVVSRRPDNVTVRLNTGIPARFHAVPPAVHPFALIHHTGSRAHTLALRQRAREQGLELGAKGLSRADGSPVPCGSEEGVYNALGLPFVPPELREGAGELEVGAFPQLIREGDVRGVVHCHSTWSDGVNTLEEMAREAADMGFEYLVITDHSRSAGQANGLSPERVARQHLEIDEINRRSGGVRILKGIESDIHRDGWLDYNDSVLATFDVVIASVHSHLEMSKDEATRRVIKALEKPHTMILGHPTGRLLLTRPGYPLDVDKVVDAAVANGVAIEISANPRRLDMDWRHLRRARDKGTRFVIGPDAHRVEGLRNIPFGVGIARKGWLTREDVLNCRPVEEFLKCLRKP